MDRIGIYLMGGLGNQIFQYLFALKLRERLGDRVSLFIDWYLGNQVLGREASRPLLLHKVPGIKIPLHTLGLAAEEGISFPRIYRFEQEGGLRNLRNEQQQNVLVIGYFQSFDALPPAPELVGFLTGIVPKRHLAEPNVVAIHVRLGDYRYIPEVSPILPLSYYEQTLDLQPPNSRFLVFAEDIVEAQEFLRPLARRYTFEFQPPADPVQDFQLLAGMSAIVGANSTFSYVAGLAARLRGARVFFPAAEYWHGPRYCQEIEGKRELLDFGGFQLIPWGSDGSFSGSRNGIPSRQQVADLLIGAESRAR